MPIKRDLFGYIVQHDPNDPLYLDGGDSACRTALMALCGSELDIVLLPRFIIDRKLVRHPLQDKWNDPNETSRDQLVPVLAALSYYNKGPRPIEQVLTLQLLKNELLRTYRYRINSDILLPHHRLETGWWLKADIWWHTKVKPWREQNQTIALCIAAGPEWVRRYVDSHPDYKKATRAYWGGWRQQAEIGEMIIKKIEEIRQTDNLG